MNNLWSSISLKKEYIEKGIVFLIVFFCQEIYLMLLLVFLWVLGARILSMIA